MFWEKRPLSYGIRSRNSEEETMQWEVWPRQARWQEPSRRGRPGEAAPREVRRAVRGFVSARALTVGKRQSTPRWEQRTDRLRPPLAAAGT